MPVINRRSRMLSIRISDSEYRQLVAICEVKGARSVSDLAREAMQRIVAAPYGDNPDPSLSLRVAEIGERLSYLQNEILRLNRALQTQNGSPS